MELGFIYPPYYLQLIDYLCLFVTKFKQHDPKEFYKPCDSFADLYAVLFMTQVIKEPDDDIYQQLREYYNESEFAISGFAIHFSEDIEMDLFWFLKSRIKCKRLEGFYRGDFSEFISGFGNSVEFIRFTEKYLGIEKLINKQEFLYLLGLFFSENISRYRSLTQGLMRLRMIKHPYDTESSKYLLETVSRRSGIHVNYVATILQVNVSEWYRQAKIMKDEVERLEAERAAR